MQIVRKYLNNMHIINVSLRKIQRDFTPVINDPDNY